MADFWPISESMSEAIAGHAINVRTREYAIAQEAIEVGVLVTQGTVRDSAVLPDAAGDVTESALGISERLLTKVAGTNAFYDSGDPVSHVRRGLVWCPVEDSATILQHPFVRITAKATPLTNEALGRFRSDADGTDGGVATEQTECLFRTAQATAGGLALVEINLP
jgi:hypothetical protein